MATDTKNRKLPDLPAHPGSGPLSLRRLRLAVDMRQADVAAFARMQPSAVGRIEGRQHCPQVDTLAALYVAVTRYDLAAPLLYVMDPLHAEQVRAMAVERARSNAFPHSGVPLSALDQVT